MNDPCKSCGEKIEFLEFTEEITCENGHKIHKYKKGDIRDTVSAILIQKYKIYNRHKHINFKNFGLSFIIIIFSSIIALNDLDTTSNIIFLVGIILSSLLMPIKNNIVSYESSDPNIEKGIVFE
ncbi:hypothetical protein [Nitrosopumilus ureiphilus]|uniref:Uncharacterized protein n=1 Tax=Nitrosopumilus ureiphilus TaxID=1470067 RepID=A0A7D5RBF6_9ARCH|nr:hypothetical protein [Nitrosopumilus ureiphilus]QLH06942.1 hypothetical protein C5F50_07555 [Nitrosopumilus ureiphilus]